MPYTPLREKPKFDPVLYYLHLASNGEFTDSWIQASEADCMIDHLTVVCRKCKAYVNRTFWYTAWDEITPLNLRELGDWIADFVKGHQHG